MPAHAISALGTSLSGTLVDQLADGFLDQVLVLDAHGVAVFKRGPDVVLANARRDHVEVRLPKVRN